MLKVGGGGESTPTDTNDAVEPSTSLDFNSTATDTVTPEETPDMSNTDQGVPFDKEPFDAGVEADEDTDPKKFIEQLTGKLGQSLRSYEETQGQPDFELEKFAINSLLSATHTGQMDPSDQKDIINKVKKSGNDGVSDAQNDGENDGVSDGENDGVSDGENGDDLFDTDEPSVDESLLSEVSLNNNKVKSLIKMYDNGGDELKAKLSKMITYSENSTREDFINTLKDDIDTDHLNDICKSLSDDGHPVPEDIQTESIMLENPPKNNMFQPGSNDILDEMKPCWKGYKQVGMKNKNGKEVPNCVPVNENHEGGESLNYMFWQNLKTIHHASGELLDMDQQQIDEMWSSTPVSKMVAEDLNNSEKKSNFVKHTNIKTRLKETFMNTLEPITLPEVKPKVKPEPIEPSRRNKPFLPKVAPSVQPKPKAIKEGKFDYETYHKTLASTLDEVQRYVQSRGYDAFEFDMFEVEHVGYGETRRISKQLNKGGVPTRKVFEIQIYRMDSGTYELNMYVG